MEETTIEIPEQTEDGWQPPVIRHTGEKKNPQRCSDVFFMQYVVCVLLLTALFTVRLYDETVFNHLLTDFRSETTAPSAEWAESLLKQLLALWC